MERDAQRAERQNEAAEALEANYWLINKPNVIAKKLNAKKELSGIADAPKSWHNR